MTMSFGIKLEKPYQLSRDPECSNSEQKRHFNAHNFRNSCELKIKRRVNTLSKMAGSFIYFVCFSFPLNEQDYTCVNFYNINKLKI